ncbi:MAG: hypothetical protein FWC28_05010 [Proteobacteria bacterium]|nr:hypothetical protein [Cystobacterineae bacterium]MCL2259053.1 hypothetical protein [Cystobacterineae bacterium]MCL2314597.1 hypothetical protein [Pseudomonadota bacterium]
MSLFFQNHRSLQCRPGVLLLLGICWALGCKLEEYNSMPPLDAFYFPSSLTYIERAEGGEGILLVANANFDKRYKHGSVVAVDLLALGEGGLPAFGEVEGVPKQIRELNIRPENALRVSSFTGRMGAYALPGGGALRFFLPSRSEGALLHVMDMDIPRGVEALHLRCVPKPAKEESDCTQTALSLTANEEVAAKKGLPRAPSPGFAVVSPEGEVWLTHIDAADSPVGTAENHISYAIRLSAMEPQLTDEAFIPIGAYPSAAALVLGEWILLTGRGGAPVLRMLSKVEEGRVENANVESSLRISEGRDIVLSSDRKQVFLLGRYPDTFLVLYLNESTSPPSLQVVREIPLPEGPNALHILQREGQGDLVAILSSTSSALSFYDQDAGLLTGQLAFVGKGPFSIASSKRGGGARLFIGNFGDGRIAVVDVVDLKRPQDARLVAFLGKSQECLVQDTECEEEP